MKAPYFPFYPSDWLGSRKVLMMSDSQRGIYVTLLAHQWTDPSGSIPTSKALLQRMLPRSKWKNIEYVVRECFEVEGTNEERARNERLNVERTTCMIRHQKATHAGKCSANKRLQPTDVQLGFNGCSTISEPEPDSEPDRTLKHKGTRKKREPFRIPTVEEVNAYCDKRGNSVDPERFIAFYESKGWVVGKSPMKDWKAAIRSNWEREQPLPLKSDLKDSFASFRKTPGVV